MSDERRPRRIQRQRTKGWRMPEGAVYVGRPTKWGNPFAITSSWLLWVGLALGFMGDVDGRRRAAVALYRTWMTGAAPNGRPIQPGGEIGFENKRGDTWEVTADEYARGLGASFASLYKAPTLPKRPALEELRGKDLVCWCPLVDEEGNRVPCHADVLLEIANG